MNRSAGEEPVRRVVVRKGHGGHHGGAWKVAYADFVTTMMALFIVLWIISQNEGVRVAVARYFRDPGVFSEKVGAALVPGSAGLLPGDRLPGGPSPAAGEELRGGQAPGPSRVPGARRGGPAAAAEERALQAAAESIRALLEEGGLLGSLRQQVRVEVTAEGLRIEVVERENAPFFRVGSAVVLDSLRSVLEALAPVLATLPNPITIEGHTDSRPYTRSREYSNWELSTDRAHSARRLLEAAGLDPQRIDRVVGHADRVLLVPADPLDASNRRITILVRRQDAGGTAPGARSPGSPGPRVAPADPASAVTSPPASPGHAD